MILEGDMHSIIKSALMYAIVLLTCSVILNCSKSSTGEDDDDNIDIFAPAAIIDLRYTSIKTNSVTLEWTAPGDDSLTDIANEYDLRRSPDSITSLNFNSATAITDLAPPLPPGYTQQFTVEGLNPGQKYYMAIKTGDIEGNWSEISNCVNFTCLEEQIIIFSDTAFERVIRNIIGLTIGDIYLSDIENIVDITAPGENIQNLSGIENFSSLSWLSVSGNNITDLTPLAYLTDLGLLYAADNNISDLDPIASLTNLIQLHIGVNPIQDISALSGMTKLDWLRLNSTQINDFSPIYGLSSLSALDLTDNSLVNIDFVSNYTEIKELVLGANLINDITALSGLTVLENLYIAYNNISDLSALSGLPNIKYLDLRYNQISNILPLVNNSGIDSGDVVNIANNPLSTQSIEEYVPMLESRFVIVNR